MNEDDSTDEPSPRLGLPKASDALRVNLEVTAVRVEIDPRHQTLRQAVQKVAGVLAVLDRLLEELNHPYRNWRLLLPELRSFVLKNASRFIMVPQGPICLALFAEVFLKAAEETNQTELRHEALSGLTAYLDLVAELIRPDQMERFAPIFNWIFASLAECPEQDLLLLSQSRHPVKRSAMILLAKQPDGLNSSLSLNPAPIRDLAVRALRVAYDYWLQQPEPIGFAEPWAEAFQRISHPTIRAQAAILESLATEPASFDLMDRIAALPSFVDIVRGYRLAAEQLGSPDPHTAPVGSNTEKTPTIASERMMESRKLRFMFHIMNTSGLAMIHEETLREINRSLVHLVQLKQSVEELESFFLHTFRFLRDNVVTYPRTALHCIEVLGMEVFKRNTSRLVEAFLGQTVRFGFQYSAVQGVDSHWQPICNPAHLDNIRSWLNLIREQPRWCSTLFSALIINLRLTGTCIRDTDLFQKEISLLLNSQIAPVYNLVKQFARLLPVYYNEIGAEGELRDVSTELDEISRRKDRLIHFLRKQCHVESTNLIVPMAASILTFWRTGDRSVLIPFIANSVLAEVPDDGPFVNDIRALIQNLFVRHGFRRDEELLAWSLPKAEAAIQAMTDCPASEQRRLFLLIRLYQLLKLKYQLGIQAIQKPVAQAAAEGVPGMERLLTRLSSGKEGLPFLDAILDALESLQAIILGRETFPAREAIFQKRHIAADIPSVYGFYQERKFDALSLSFRLENLAGVFLEELIQRIPEDFITRAAFFRIAKYLRYFLRALKLDGINARKFQNYLDILERSLRSVSFSYPQYLDLFSGFAEGVQEIIYAYYTSHHRDNLAVIVPMIPTAALLPRFAVLRNRVGNGGGDEDPVISLERISEVFMRDLLAESFGLQSLDRLISRVRKILYRQAERLSAAQLDLLLSYDPANLFCSIHQPQDRTLSPVHLGNKGYNLVQLATQRLPVPAGVILTTEFCRCQELIRHDAPALQDFVQQLREQVRAIEDQTGLGFGDPKRPLLLSVRSGALISMPGMMQTIHNVGINPEILDGLIAHTGSSRFAWDTYRRFIQSWSMTFHVRRDTFNDQMRRAKQRYRVHKKSEFTSTQMEELAADYRTLADTNRIVIPDDPWQQLLLAIDQVVASWSATKANEYRRIMSISDRWGTAVVIQAMVYGNLGTQSGSGVLFTAHPHRKLDRVVLWGDYTPGNQGEDIVSGLVTTRPISVEQSRYDGRDPETCLERLFPAIYQGLLEAARLLVYEHRWNPQEIEFTFEGPNRSNLFFLQTRDMVAAEHRRTVRQTFRPGPELAAARLAQGIGVSGSVLCGLAVFNLEQIGQLREQDPAIPLILIRYDTVPDDILEIAMADGLLTTRGGQTSHASIVAARLNKVCVVGCEEVTVQDNGWCRARGQVICPGDRVSLDGNRGLFLAGWHEIETVLANEPWSAPSED